MKSPRFLRSVVPLLFVIVVPCFGQSPAPAAVPAAPLEKMGSKVFPWESFVAKKTANGERREVANLPTATLERFESHISTLNPGEKSHPPHIHNQEEFII